MNLQWESISRHLYWIETFLLAFLAVQQHNLRTNVYYHAEFRISIWSIKILVHSSVLPTTEKCHQINTNLVYACLKNSDMHGPTKHKENHMKTMLPFSWKGQCHSLAVIITHIHPAPAIFLFSQYHWLPLIQWAKLKGSNIMSFQPLSIRFIC